MKAPVRALAAATIIFLCSAGSAPLFAQTVERFGTRSPRVCADIKSKPSPEQAAALIQCRTETMSEGQIYLLEKVRVQIGAAQAYNERTHAFLTGVDTTSKVYPIRGSLTSYTCVRIKDGGKGTNCVTVAGPNAQGYCWPTTFGTWDCIFSGPDSDPVPNQPPPPAS